MFIIYQFLFQLNIYVTMYLLFVAITSQFLPFPWPLCVCLVHLAFSLMLLLNFRGYGQSNAIQFQLSSVVSAVVSRCCSLLFGLTKGYYIKEIACSLYWLHLWIFVFMCIGFLMLRGISEGLSPPGSHSLPQDPVSKIANLPIIP